MIMAGGVTAWFPKGTPYLNETEPLISSRQWCQQFPLVLLLRMVSWWLVYKATTCSHFINRFTYWSGFSCVILCDCFSSSMFINSIRLYYSVIRIDCFIYCKNAWLIYPSTCSRYSLILALSYRPSSFFHCLNSLSVLYTFDHNSGPWLVSVQPS